MKTLVVECKGGKSSQLTLLKRQERVVVAMSVCRSVSWLVGPPLLSKLKYFNNYRNLIRQPIEPHCEPRYVEVVYTGSGHILTQFGSILMKCQSSLR